MDENIKGKLYHLGGNSGSLLSFYYGRDDSIRDTALYPDQGAG